MIKNTETSSEPTCDYSNITDEKLKSALIAGEAEWIKNATYTYWSDAINVWEEDVLPRIVANTMQEIDWEDLDLYCPILLAFLRDYYS